MPTKWTNEELLSERERRHREKIASDALNLIRDKQSEEILNLLSNFGVEAQITRQDDTQGDKHTTVWLIELLSGLISHVNITEEYESWVIPYGSGDSENTSINIEYFIDDHRVDLAVPHVSIRAGRIKKYRLFGPVTGVRWSEPHDWDPQRWHPVDSERDEFDTGIIQQLRQDESIMKSIENDPAKLEIHADHDNHRWVFRKSRQASESLSHDDLLRLLGPTKQQWDGYQSIAKVLIGTPIPEQQDTKPAAKPTSRPCPDCGGTGTRGPVFKCSGCDGSGTMSE